MSTFINKALASAHQTMDQANAFSNSMPPMPKPQQPMGAGHAIGVAFANAHGNDHQGGQPNDIKGSLDWQAQQAYILQNQPK